MLKEYYFFAFCSYFSSKDVTVKETPDATIGEFKRNGKVIATVYDFSKGYADGSASADDNLFKDVVKDEEVLQEQMEEIADTIFKGKPQFNLKKILIFFHLFLS